MVTQGIGINGDADGWEGPSARQPRRSAKPTPAASTENPVNAVPGQDSDLSYTAMLEDAPIRKSSYRRRDPGQQSAVPRSSRQLEGPGAKAAYSQSSRQPEYSNPGSRRYVSDPLAAAAPANAGVERNPSMRRTSVPQGDVNRRGSLTERSPLQRLETHLDDISKEEKRARILEAELAAQERLSGAQAASARAADAIGTDRTYQGSAGGAPGAGSQSQIRRRSVRDPARTINDSAGYPNEPRPIDVVSGTVRRKPHPESARRERSDTGQDNRARGQRPATNFQAPLSVNTDASRAVNDQPRNETEDPSSSVPAERRRSRRGQEAGTKDFDPSRHTESSDSRAGYEQMHIDRMGRGNIFAGKQDASRETEPDIISPESVRLPPGRGPTYKIPPRSTGGFVAKNAVSFDNETEPPNEADASIPTTPSTKKPRPWSNLFGMRKTSGKAGPNKDESAADKSMQSSHSLRRGHQDARRYQPGKAPPEEWRSMKPALLMAEDLDIDMMKPTKQAPQDESGKAWWEKSESERRRSSGSQKRPEAAATTYEGNYDSRSGQTYFMPQIYLKCGPLLRFTGIRKLEQSAATRGTDRMAREIWTGSVMIVTYDAKSSYDQPPTLRLFAQPVKLLPPPPAEVNLTSGQQLASEYVDPVAGQIKMSRVGKTLYAKPVEELDEHKDLSRIENDKGLFSEKRPAESDRTGKKGGQPGYPGSTYGGKDGEKVGKVREIRGSRLYADRGVTFWKFKIEIELGSHQARVAYRINRGPAIGFWVPGRGQVMNMMFHSCNGFSLAVDANEFSGPDPMWRDVLNTHQFRPIHVMIGGGDQIYNDAITAQTKLFKQWAEMKNPHHKNTAEFTAELQDELEGFYLNRYSMWFSQGLFGMANSQIPMVNIWDDHDIIDGFGSYPHHTMSSPVFAGVGAVAFKYYMLFQHQSVPQETEREEPSWLLGAAPGPYIEQKSRSVFMHLGHQVAFLGLDCRTERMRDMILCEETWDLIFARCRREIVKNETKHLIVLLGVPIAYPRLNFVENILTSRMMDPLKALGRTGMLGGFVNKFDGGVEILDDLDDHWTAKHHKSERNWFVQELQTLAAEKSVRVTILGGDVHLAAVGQFYSNPRLGIPKDRDHRYMPNIVSSAIVNTPPGDMLADVLNKRNKVHHLDLDTDEGMIAMFARDVDGKARNNTHLLPRRNWCSIRQYNPGESPPPSRASTPHELGGADFPVEDEQPGAGSGIRRSLSLGKGGPGGLMRRLSGKGSSARPPISYYNSTGPPDANRRRASSDGIPSRPRQSSDFNETRQRPGSSSAVEGGPGPGSFHRRPTFSSVAKDDERGGHIDLTGGLDISLNVENVRGDPAGTTTQYRLLVPALDYRGVPQRAPAKKQGMFASLFSGKKKAKDDRSRSASPEADDVSRRGSSRSGHSLSSEEGGMYAQPAHKHHDPPASRHDSHVTNSSRRRSGQEQSDPRMAGPAAEPYNDPSRRQVSSGQQRVGQLPISQGPPSTTAAMIAQGLNPDKPPPSTTAALIARGVNPQPAGMRASDGQMYGQSRAPNQSRRVSDGQGGPYQNRQQQQYPDEDRVPLRANRRAVSAPMNQQPPHHHQQHHHHQANGDRYDRRSGHPYGPDQGHPPRHEGHHDPRRENRSPAGGYHSAEEEEEYDEPDYDERADGRRRLSKPARTGGGGERKSWQFWK